MFNQLPHSAAWRHLAARDGFEAVFIRPMRRGWHFEGHTSAVESDRPWTVHYEITVDDRWHTRRARVSLWSGTDQRRRTLRGDGSGRWEIDGDHAPRLDGCLDVDLEASACTNTLPVHRLTPVADHEYDAPAAYVRVSELTVERLEQRYTQRSFGVYDYEAPAFDFRCQLRYDSSGLVVDYPGIAVRAG